MIKINENLCMQPASQPSLELVMLETTYFKEYLAIKNVQAGVYNLIYDIKTDNEGPLYLNLGLGNESGYQRDNPSWTWTGVQNKGERITEFVVEQSYLDSYPERPHLWIRYRNSRVAMTMISKGLRIHREGEVSDIWTPAHADLTPEQIATLPPYGEYKEIKAF